MFIGDYLSSMPLGHQERLATGEHITKCGDDDFVVQDRYNLNAERGDTSWVINSIIGNGNNNPWGIGGASVTSVGMGGLTHVHWPQPPNISTEDLKELEGLETEVKQFVKQKKLSKFRALPRHLRQEIVDDGYVRDLIKDMSEASEQDFPDAQRLAELRNKRHSWNSAHHTVNIGSMFSYELPGGFSSRYSQILNQFTTEELAKAHADACLEEDLQS
jgi:hypothetical protein